MQFDYRSEPLLIQAVLKNNLDKVRASLKKNANNIINYQTQADKVSALHIAVHCRQKGRHKDDERIEQEKVSLNDNLESNQTEDVVVEGEEEATATTTTTTTTTKDEEGEKLSELGQDEQNLEIIRLLCKSGSRVNIKDGKNLTPLHYACRANNHKAVEVLIQYNGDVNGRDKNWQTPLHVACIYDSFECAALLCQRVLNIDATDRQGRSALAYASFNGNLKMVALLLENGANCNIKDKSERRPIHWASYVGYTDVVRKLHEHGADINCLDKDLYTPLLAACASGKSEEMIKLLIELGADTQASTLNGSTIFHVACLNGQEHIVRYLLNNRELEMRVNARGYHPLHFAAGCKHGSFCVELLTSIQSCDVNLASFSDGKTPMHIAAMHGLTTNAQILFSNGANLNVKDSEGNTPLFQAAARGHQSMVEFLIESGSNVYITGSSNMLPFAIATLNGHSNWFKILGQAVPSIAARREYFESRDEKNRTFTHLAAISGNLEILRLLLKIGCNPNVKDENYNTPLHYACIGCHLKCVELLIASGGRTDELNESIMDYFANNTDMTDLTTPTSIPQTLIGFGCTPLMLACAFDQDGLVVRELVFNANAKVNITDKNGYNTLHYAALQGNRNVMEILSGHFPKDHDHQQNDQKISPLHLLVYHGNQDGLEVLIRNECIDLELRDKNGRTCLDLACFQGELGCVRSLIRAGANCECRDSIDERTPVHAAAYSNNLECLKEIMSAHYDAAHRLANLCDRHQRTPLMYATEQGHLSTISFLISHMGANVLLADAQQRTALHRAASLGYEECCQEILRTNIETASQRDQNGMLPIHYAVMGGHANLIGLFIDYHQQMTTNSMAKKRSSRDEKLVDWSGLSLLHIACYNGHSTCVETICELGDTVAPYLTEMLTGPLLPPIYNRFSPLHCTCLNSHTSCLAYLLERYATAADFLVCDDEQNTCLHLCALNNEHECAALLIEAGCDVNRVNRLGRSALMLAAMSNSFAVVELLIKRSATVAAASAGGGNNLNSTIDIRRAEVDLVDVDGNNALHLALINKHENCALFILDELKEDMPIINTQNKHGDTPLHIAARNGLATSVEILLNKGADIWLKNANAKTPLLSCARDDHVAECLDLMLAQLILTVSATAAATATSTATTASATTTTNTPAQTAANTNGLQMKPGQTYTPLKPAGLIRSSNTTPRNGGPNHHRRDKAATLPTNSTVNCAPDTSLITTSDIMLNDVHMNPLGGANLTLSNGSLNNLNSTLINPNDYEDEEEEENDEEYIEEQQEIVTHNSQPSHEIYADNKTTNNRSFDAYTTASEIELAASLETEFY